MFFEFWMVPWNEIISKFFDIFRTCSILWNLSRHVKKFKMWRYMDVKGKIKLGQVEKNSFLTFFSN